MSRTTNQIEPSRSDGQVTGHSHSSQPAENDRLPTLNASSQDESQPIPQHQQNQSTADRSTNRNVNHTNNTTRRNAGSVENNNPNNNGRFMRVRITVSTVSPRSSTVSPELYELHVHYPRDFENFTEQHVVNCVTNEMHRHIQSFRSLKASSIPHPSDPKSVFFSVTEPTISLFAYVQRVVRYSKVARLHILMMVIYVNRIATKHIALAPSERNVHRLMTGGLALAAKQHGTLDAEHARRVAGLPSTAELTKIVDGFYHFIDRNTAITREEVVSTFNRLSAMRHATGVPSEESMSAMTNATQTDERPSNEDGRGEERGGASASSEDIQGD